MMIPKKSALQYLANMTYYKCTKDIGFKGNRYIKSRRRAAKGWLSNFEKNFELKAREGINTYYYPKKDASYR